MTLSMGGMNIWNTSKDTGSLSKRRNPYRPCLAGDVPNLRTNILIPSLEKGGKGGFEDLRRELVSRKYSYKTVKGYLYY